MQLRNRLSDTKIWHLVFFPRILVILPAQFQISETTFIVQPSCGLCHKLTSEWTVRNFKAKYLNGVVLRCKFVLTWIKSNSSAIHMWFFHIRRFSLTNKIRMSRKPFRLFYKIRLFRRRIDDDQGRTKELSLTAVKTMRGILECWMYQANKVEMFKKTQVSKNSLHVLFHTVTQQSVTEDEEYEHLQVLCKLFL